MSPLPPIHFELLPPVPAISLVRRLKEIPLFRFASTDELFRVATISRQVRYPADARVQERGAPAEYIQVLVQGRFRLEDGERSSAVVAPPAMLGFQEVLKGTALQSSAASETESIALVMPADEFRTLLAANIELAQGLFRMLLDSPEERDEALLAGRPAPLRNEHREGPLRTMEKVMYLGAIPILSHATAEEIYEVSALAREIPLAEGEVLFPAGSPPFILLLLAGALELSSPTGESRKVHAGSSIGVRETLAGVNLGETARVAGSGCALQIDREPLFELLADRMDLLQGIFSAVFHHQAARPIGYR
jgi:CRP-like cAMP-binding protein